MRRKKSGRSSSSSASSMDPNPNPNERERERHSSSHRSTSGGGGSELFICFTSRPSASSSSAAAAAPSLSTSLSRRLKNSGSLKGGAQSPMFTAVVGGGRRNKGSGFETAEPSSPKVTCIGQVRVKGHKRRSKVKGAISRSRSKRVVGAEASFRRGDEMGREKECLSGGKNQGWVYQIPVSICEALKAVGSEFNCLLPCSGRSFCSSSSGHKAAGEETAKGKRRGSCGAVFARWLMLQESEEGKRGRHRLEEEEDEVEMEMDMEMERRKEELGMVVREWEERRIEEFVEVEVAKKDEILVVGEEEEGRISVCIPPKNALLLMRCRSDPVRMAALANKLWGSPVRKVHVQQEPEREEEEEDEEEEEEVSSDVQSNAGIGEERGRECEEVPVSEEEEALCEAVETDLKEAQSEVNDFCSEVVEREEDLKEMQQSEVHLGEIYSDDDDDDEPCVDGSDQKKKISHGGEEQLEQPEAVSNLDPVVGSGKTEMDGQDGQDGEKISAKGEQTDRIKGKRSTSCSPSRPKEEKKGTGGRYYYRMRRQGSSKGGSSSREREARRHSFSSEGGRSSFSSVKEARRSSFSMEGRRWSFSIEQEEIVIAAGSKAGKVSELEKENVEGDNNGNQEKNGKEGDEMVGLRRGEAENNKCEKEMMQMKVVSERKKKSGELPDCLLLMMYEPKLSMEVSKETWVRPTDFINWKTHRRQNHPKANNNNNNNTGEGTVNEEGQKDDAQKDTQVTETENHDLEPAVAPEPVIKAAEQNVKVELPIPAEVLYAPFVLKRCKSEPMRSSARLVADACFWKERHRPIGATGVGF